MKCDLCNGTGKLLKNWYDTTGLMTHFKGDVCFMCDGKGTIGEQMTNEEWFCGLPTEEKAKFFSYEMRCEFCQNQEQCDSLGANCKVLWELWLKQPHTSQKHDDYPCNVKGCSLETRQACCGCPDYFEWEKQNKE